MTRIPGDETRTELGFVFRFCLRFQKRRLRLREGRKYQTRGNGQYGTHNPKRSAMRH